MHLSFSVCLVAGKCEESERLRNSCFSFVKRKKVKIAELFRHLWWITGVNFVNFFVLALM